MKEWKKGKEIEECLKEIEECLFCKEWICFCIVKNELNCSVTLKELLKLKSHQI